MAKVLDARAAALEIRGKMQQPSPEDRHIEKFVGEVLDQLGLEHTIANASMVVHALRDADIQPHRVEEYPKAVTVKVTNEAKYGDDKEHAETFTVNNEDEERELNDKHAFTAPQPEYPKSIMVRGTDGFEHPQIVRDLKEERELLGVGVSAIDPEASTQFKKAQLEPPTEEEIGVAKVTSRGGEMQKQALDQANKPKVGAGTNVSNPPDEQDEPVDEDYVEAEAAPEPPAPPVAPVRTGPRPPPKRA